MKKLAFAAALLTATVIPAAAQAQVGVADIPAAVQQTTAFQTATTQMKTTYKPQIDAFNAKQASLAAEIKPMVDAFQAARAKPGATDAQLKPQYDAIQAKQAAMQQQLAPLYQPLARAQAYVEDQIVQKLDQATKSAMTARQVKVLLKPDAAYAFDPTADITPAIVAELNKLVPTASITPPANWQPGQAPAGATPANPAPQGR